MAIQKNIEIEKIHYDLGNPSIRRVMEIYPEQNINEAHISLALGSGSPTEGEQNVPTYNSLKASIRESGRIIQPIIVNQSVDGGYCVIEGNTRLSIYKEFLLLDHFYIRCLLVHND